MLFEVNVARCIHQLFKINFTLTFVWFRSLGDFLGHTGSNPNYGRKSFITPITRRLFLWCSYWCRLSCMRVSPRAGGNKSYAVSLRGHSRCWKCLFWRNLGLLWRLLTFNWASRRHTHSCSRCPTIRTTEADLPNLILWPVCLHKMLLVPLDANWDKVGRYFFL